MERYAEIVLPAPTAILFTYSVPEDLLSTINIGSRVLVQFGKKKFYSGIVHRIHDDKPEDFDLKPILSIVDQQPIVVARQMDIWHWIADYYMCTLGEVYRAALPAGLRLESESCVVYNPSYDQDEDVLPEKMQAILTYVQAKKSCRIADLIKDFEFNVTAQVRKLLDLQALLIDEKLKDSYRPPTELHIALHDNLRKESLLATAIDQLESVKRTQAQCEALLAFIDLAGGVKSAINGKTLPKNEAIKDPKITEILINALCSKNILKKEKLNVARTEKQTELLPLHPLTEPQNGALEQINSAFEHKDVCLLHGVTSSGKTEIYIHLISKYLAKGKQVLYLLPEIALTTQITDRLRRHFGNILGIYHSKFSDAQRCELWNKLLTGEYKIILGVRSSVLLPFDNLGLIIVDEEHETSYKQFDPAPRYNARDVAIVLAKLHNGKTLLGSATPSFESYYNAKNDKYGYVELQTRFEGVELPEIIPVNMRLARQRHATVEHFSFKLKEGIETTLTEREQVILFQNRRGFSPFIECRQCSWVAKCANCDVSLTYHKNSNSLVCHYCSYTVQLPKTCPQCATASLETQGFGTEKIEEEVATVFPEAKVVRMDLDTANTRKQYERIIDNFSRGDQDILIGTQMIAKGLDFSRVTTVGVMNADNMLNMPDFRANERAFQLIAQVSGRAGRRDKRGKVYLQTSNDEHPVIRNLINNDYLTHVTAGLAEREAYTFPPFTRLVNLSVRHKDWQMARHAAIILADELRKLFGNRVLGPVPPPVARIATYYIERITLKIEKTLSPSTVKIAMMDRINNVIGDINFHGVSVSIDVDPY